MATVITTLTGVETKLGGEGDEAWTLYRFTGTVDGQEKVFQTFDDDLAQLIQRDFMRQPIALEFEVETRTYTAKQGPKKGQTLTAMNNVIQGVALPSGQPISGAAQQNPAGFAAPLATVGEEVLRLTAFNSALKLVELGIVTFEDQPSFTDVTRIADAVFAYADGSMNELASESDPEDIAPPAATGVTN